MSNDGNNFAASEGSNPTISCGFSRESRWPELEEHAPAPMTDPFTVSSFIEKKLDTANEGLIES